MCRIEERIYINQNGHRSKFEEAFPCDKSRNGKLCSKINKRTSEYWHNKGSNGRDDSLSPLNPPTPTGPGSYTLLPVRPSSSGERPSTRDGQRAINPEIVIDFGSRKGKGKKYPIVSISAQSQKRSSAGSSEFPIDSPGSDASYTMRTGFPETSLPPQAPLYGRSDGYSTTPIASRPHHHRHTSSTSSYTGSSQPPSLYVTSDPDHDSPDNQRSSRYASTVVHNSSSHVTASSPSRPRVRTDQPTSDYSTTVVTPTRYAQDTYTPDGLFPLDYPADRSASSHASSAVSGGSRHAKEPSRKKATDDRRRQDDLDRAAAKAKEENTKQVRFELGRAESRTRERAESAFAEKEKQRATVREEARRMKEAEREPHATQEPKKHKSRTSTNDHGAKLSGKSRRLSMTQAQMEEQKRLLEADEEHMRGESVAADAREREERNALLRQQQQDPNYYNPRAGISSAIAASNAAPLSRRDSTSRRRSISSADALPAIGRSNSNRRPHVSQPNPPAIHTQVASSHTRTPSARTHQPPPVSFPASFNANPPSARRPSFSGQENPSARRPSFSSHENPFAAPPTRGTGSSVENPFTPTAQVLSPAALIHQDPWDLRNVSEVLPSARLISDGRYTMERRGLDVINNAGSHTAARRATRAMRGAADYDDYAISSYDDRTHGHARRRR